jgi:hypothetical protein
MTLVSVVGGLLYGILAYREGVDNASIRGSRGVCANGEESYFNETAPLYLFMAYAKSAQENPSPAAMAILAKLAEAAKAGIKAKQKER